MVSGASTNEDFVKVNYILYFALITMYVEYKRRSLSSV